MTFNPLPRPAGPYRGRFAPSPTGPLHFGSVVTALGGFLQARSRDGEWQLRIDDIDPDRDSSAALALIPRQLEAFGLHWDGAIVYQSHRAARHREALQTLLDSGRAFYCGCSRREIGDGIYPGTCRNGLPAGKAARSVRVRVDDARPAFDDPLQGHVTSDLATEVGDFVIRRADGLIAYQLAAAVDDADGGFTEIVRGADLLSSTLRQIWLHRCLDLPSPAYLHLPIAVDANGDKLSKQTHAPPLDSARPGPQLVAALTFLEQRPPTELAVYAPADILDWAVAHWQPQRLRGVAARPAPVAMQAGRFNMEAPQEDGERHGRQNS
ncbi:MAG TPA: tRNA glutamyl-Q(34) synthetase GluQRS [Gammaproteobacteria bacterium]|nr:tRNA glutamyl-Q(34) synthetase GluQRS [Gammaproteobacteria bacterium]